MIAFSAGEPIVIIRKTVDGKVQPLYALAAQHGE